MIILGSVYYSYAPPLDQADSNLQYAYASPKLTLNKLKTSFTILSNWRKHFFPKNVFTYMRLNKEYKYLGMY